MPQRRRAETRQGELGARPERLRSPSSTSSWRTSSAPSWVRASISACLTTCGGFRKAGRVRQTRLHFSLLTYSLFGLLGESGARTLDGASGVADSFGVDAHLRYVSLSLGLLDAVPVGLLVLVVVRVHYSWLLITN